MADYRYIIKPRASRKIFSFYQNVAKKYRHTYDKGDLKRDVPTTYADATALERDFGFTPKITLREGLRHFAEWYKEYYG